jgi:hypothetical protein
MKLNRHDILNALLLSLNESKYLNNFPHKVMHEFSTLGYAAATKQDSNIYTLLKGLAASLEQQFDKYDFELPKFKKPTKKELKTIKELQALKLSEDMDRQNNLEASWYAEESRKRDEADEKDRLKTAERCAQNILKMQGIK